MKKLERYIYYVTAIVALITFSLYTFRYHPELQFVFMMPGMFLIIVSAFINDFSERVRMIKGR